MLHSMRETIGMNKGQSESGGGESPGMLVELIFYVITGAVLPYAGIYFSAQIITELAGAKIRLFYAIWYCSYSESRACWD